jgi:hypothetical protein
MMRFSASHQIWLSSCRGLLCRGDRVENRKRSQGGKMADHSLKEASLGLSEHWSIIFQRKESPRQCHRCILLSVLRYAYAEGARGLMGGL